MRIFGSEVCICTVIGSRCSLRTTRRAVRSRGRAAATTNGAGGIDATSAAPGDPARRRPQREHQHQNRRHPRNPGQPAPRPRARSNSAITRVRTAVKCAAAGNSMCAACRTARLSRHPTTRPGSPGTRPDAAPPPPLGARKVAAGVQRDPLFPFHAIHDRLPKYRSTKPSPSPAPSRSATAPWPRSNPGRAPRPPWRALPDRAARAPRAPFPAASAGSIPRTAAARSRSTPGADRSPAVSWPAVFHRALRPAAAPQIVAGVHRDPVEPAGSAASAASFPRFL